MVGLSVLRISSPKGVFHLNLQAYKFHLESLNPCPKCDGIPLFNVHFTACISCPTGKSVLLKSAQSGAGESVKGSGVKMSLSNLCRSVRSEDEFSASLWALLWSGYWSKSLGFSLCMCLAYRWCTAGTGAYHGYPYCGVRKLLV